MHKFCLVVSHHTCLFHGYDEKLSLLSNVKITLDLTMVSFTNTKTAGIRFHEISQRHEFCKTCEWHHMLLMLVVFHTTIAGEFFVFIWRDGAGCGED